MTPPTDRPRWSGWDLGALYVASQVAAVVIVFAVALYEGIVTGGDAARAERTATVAAYLLSPVLLVLLEFGLLALRRALDAGRRLYDRTAGWRRIVGWGILGGAAVKAASDVTTWLESLFVRHIEPNNPLVTDPEAFSSTPVLVGLFVSVVIFAPLGEELFYRGLLFGLLRRRGFWVAGLGSAALFGAAHLSLTLFLPLSVTGFGLAVIYERTRSLWASTIAHAFFNGVALVTTIATWHL